jgi:hypothetical protein
LKKKNVEASWKKKESNFGKNRKNKKKKRKKRKVKTKKGMHCGLLL